MRLILISFLTCISQLLSLAQSQRPYLFIGTYTNGKSEGIYVYRFDTKAGTASYVSHIKTDNPSYIAVSKHHPFIYAVKEQSSAQLNEVSAFRFDDQSGTLELVNSRSILGAGPCYITVDSKNKWVFTANYKGGSVSGIPLKEDGSLDSIRYFNQHTGKSINPKRQQEPHAHCAMFSPDEQYLYTTDLGTDVINQYRFNAKNAVQPLQTKADSVIFSKPGNGPRHLCFAPKAPFLYAINELSGTIDQFQLSKGIPKLVASVSTDSTNNADKGSADIHISADGRFLYATNRGNYNNISTFSIHPKTGFLTLLQVLPTGGISPRNFTIDPSGNYLLVGHQRSDFITIFKRNPSTGLLQPTSNKIEVSSAVCLKFR